MPALIHLYESFSEALHAIQELEAAKIAPEDISLVSLSHKQTSRGQAEPDKAHSKRATDHRPLDTDLRAKFFATVHVHHLAGLEAVLAGGWIADGTIEKTPEVDIGPNGHGLSTAPATGLLACLTENGLAKDLADTYLEGIKRGATLLGVRVADKQQKIAMQILREDHCPVDPRMRGRHYAAKQTGLKDMNKVNSDKTSSMLIGSLPKR